MKYFPISMRISRALLTVSGTVLSLAMMPQAVIAADVVATTATPTPASIPLKKENAAVIAPAASAASGQQNGVVKTEPVIPQATSTVASTTASATSSVPSSIDEIPMITLRDAVGSGVKTNPEYGSIHNNRRATDEELRQAQGGYYPSIDVSSDAGWDWISSDARGSSRETDSLWRAQAGLTMTQMLFDGYNTKYEVERQKSRVESAAYRVWETSEFVGLDIVESYLNVLRQRELLEIARANVTRHLEIEKQMKESSTAGRTTEADVEQSRARLAAARANESSVRESLRTSEASYIKLVGQLPKTLVRPDKPGAALLETVDEEVRAALEQSPTIASKTADIDTAQSEWKQSESTFYPSVDLVGNVTQANDSSGSEAVSSRAQALVRMNWNLYRGGADSARVREGVYRYAQSKEDRARSARAVEEDVRQTWAQMVSASERAQEFGVQSESNEKVVAAYMDQFNLDRRTLLDVLDAQNENFVSRSNMINAEYVELFAAYRLLAIRGQLLSTLDIPYPAGMDPNDHYMN